MAIEVTGVAPLVQVFDMPRSIRFYRDVLGFAVTGRSKALSDDPDDVNWCMLELAPATVMLNTAYDPDDVPDAPDAARWEGHQDTGLFFGCPDVDAAYRHLVEMGVKVDPPKVAWYGMKQLSVTDPDGFGLCFQWTATEEERAAAVGARAAE
jgi:catechol 2,3-dioxygenase-like lactoylglutathione lyase family enzyme